MTDKHIPRYLIGTPKLGDYLEEGLAALGISLEIVRDRSSLTTLDQNENGQQIMAPLPREVKQRRLCREACTAPAH